LPQYLEDHPTTRETPDADWDDPKVNENPPINLLPEIGGPILSLPIFCWFVDLGLEPIGGLLLEIGLPTFHSWRFIVGLVCGYGSARGAPFFFPIAGIDGPVINPGVKHQLRTVGPTTLVIASVYVSVYLR